MKNHLLNQNLRGVVMAVSIAPKKGMKKINQKIVSLKENLGIESDAHAGFAHRQVSLLSMESIKKILDKGLNVSPGDFAENITTQGMDLTAIVIGDLLIFDSGVQLKVTQIGKECHDGCEIFQQIGECVMPKEGIFCSVLKGGHIKPQDTFILQHQ